MQFITEVSIVVLMVGTLVGGIAQIGEAGSTAILFFNPNASGPMVNGSGRILMVIFVLAIVAPLCTLRNMRRVNELAVLCCAVLCCAVKVLACVDIAMTCPALQCNLPCMFSCVCHPACVLPCWPVCVLPCLFTMSRLAGVHAVDVVQR